MGTSAPGTLGDRRTDEMPWKAIGPAAERRAGAAGEAEFLDEVKEVEAAHRGIGSHGRFLVVGLAGLE